MQFAKPTKPRQEIRVSSDPRVHRLGILISGRGSNFLAIAEAIAQGRLANATSRS